MKNILLLLFAVSFLASCEKNQAPIAIPDDPIDPVPIDTSIIELEKVFVLKNGVEWNAAFKARYHTDGQYRFNLRAELQHANFLSEFFSLQDIPASVGKYPIEYRHPMNYNNFIPESFHYFMFDSDAGVGIYMVDTIRNDHFVEVLRHDSANKIVEGRFQVYLGKVPMNSPNLYQGLPDSIYLTEGKFHLNVQ
jgi:hypothetical protein